MISNVPAPVFVSVFATVFRVVFRLIPMLLIAGCGGGAGGVSIAERVAHLPAPPADIVPGERLFTSNCAGCHGIRAAGSDRGPTFLSKIYAPDHHGDVAFERAPQQGVRAHHWSFGDMPKISGVTPEDVREIIRYIRWLQTEAVSAGIY